MMHFHYTRVEMAKRPTPVVSRSKTHLRIYNSQYDTFIQLLISLFFTSFCCNNKDNCVGWKKRSRSNISIIFICAFINYPRMKEILLSCLFRVLIKIVRTSPIHGMVCIIDGFVITIKNYSDFIVFDVITN